MVDWKLMPITVFDTRDRIFYEAVVYGILIRVYGWPWVWGI